jgi:hypothetical protein
MTADDWWALVEQNPDDDETREAFAVWLQDEANDQAGNALVRSGAMPLERSLALVARMERGGYGP